MMAARIFPELLIRNLDYTKFTKRELHIFSKKKKKTQIHKILQFPSTNFLILKSSYNNLIINTSSYIFFKILVK